MRRCLTLVSAREHGGLEDKRVSHFRFQKAILTTTSSRIAANVPSRATFAANCSSPRVSVVRPSVRPSVRARVNESESRERALNPYLAKRPTFSPSNRFARANQNPRKRGRGKKMANVVSLGSSVSLRVVL